MWKTEKQIAEELGITSCTVCRHISQMRGLDMFKDHIYGHGRATRVDMDAYWYWYNNRAALREPEGRKWHEAEFRKEVR